MTRREIKLNLDDVPWISIGRCGTSGTHEIIFDFSMFTEAFGDGNFALLFVRPGDPDNQPLENITVPVMITGNKAKWIVRDIDTERTGAGAGQILYYGDTFRYKSNVFPINVRRSI